MKTLNGSYRTVDGKAQIEWTLEPKENGLEFSASGEFDGGAGQCLESIAKAYPRDEMVQRIVKVWREYHLNGMNAGTPEQTREIERQITAAKATHPDLVYPDGDLNYYALAKKLGLPGTNAGHYDLCLLWLKAANLYEVPLPAGMAATGGFPAEVVSGARGYHYGERWIYRPIPPAVITEIESWGNTPQPVGSLGEFKAAKFLADHGLKMRIHQSDTKPAPREKAGHHYRITVTRPGTRGARLVFDFWGSLADMEEGKTTEPSAVLSCIASDIHCPETFEDFCGEFGYEADSIKAKQTFNRASKFSARLKAFFTDGEIEALGELRD